jgi:ArsR family transcriptional regulator
MKIKIYELIADLLNAIGHPNRLRILEFLKDGEKCNSEIFPALELEQSNLSRHMKILQEVGIVSSRKEGLKVYYNTENSKIYGLIDSLTEIVKNNIKRNMALFE